MADYQQVGGTEDDGVFKNIRRQLGVYRTNFSRMDYALTGVSVVVAVLLLFAVIGGCVCWYNYVYQQDMGNMLKRAFKFSSKHNGFGLIEDRMIAELPWYFKLNVSITQNLNMEDGAGLHFYPGLPLHSRNVQHEEEQEGGKRMILPSAHQYGILFHNGELGIIDMDGGNIINVHDLYADNIYGSVSSRVNGSTADNIAPGLAVGLLTNGNVSIGFSPNPGSHPPVVNGYQAYTSGTAVLVATARYNINKTANAYLDDNGAIFLYVATRDDDTGVTTTSEPVEILAAGIALGARTFKLISLGTADGNCANSVVLVYINNGASDNIYVRVMDLTDPEAPVFQDPFGSDQPGFGVLKTITPRIQDAVAITHTHTLGEDPSSRWIILAFSDVSGNNSAVPLTTNETIVGVPVFANVDGGWVYGFNVLANATATYTWPLNYAPIRQIGAVVDAGNVSTSNDLQGDCDQCIKLHFGGVLQTYGVSSRAGGSLEGLQFEMEQLVLPAKTLNLTANGRLAGYTLQTGNNQGADDFYWGADLGQVDGSGIQFYHAAYVIGESQFGHVFSMLVNNSASTSDSYTGQFGNDVQYPYSSYVGSLVSVAATCSDRVIITYTTTSFGSQHTVSVLLETQTPSRCLPTGCQYTGTPVYASAYEAYVAQTVWSNLAASSYSCTTLTPFFTTYTAYDMFSQYNSTIYSTSGMVGQYTLTYADLISPEFVVGVSVGYTNLTTYLVEYQTSGSLDLSTLPNGILGRTCPFEAPFYVYACSNGSLSDSQFCRDPSATNPGPLVGYANVDCTLTVNVPLQAA